MKINVAIIFGGRSVEHEISVITANQAINAFDSDKYNIIPIYISKQGKWFTGEALLDLKNYKDMNTLMTKCQEVYMMPEFGNYNLYKKKSSVFGSNIEAVIDVVIPALHGTNGEDGIFEGVLETIGIPYAGCNTVSSANGMDKITMKMIMAASNIPILDYEWFTDKEWYAKKEAIIERIESHLGYPVIIKPANLGSSVGIGRAANKEELIEKVETAEKYSTRLVVEHMVDDLKEINCSVLGDCDEYQSSVCEEPIKSGDILSYEDKYMGGSKSERGMQASQKRIPAELSKETTERIQFLAGETFRVLSCHGVSRVDFIIDNSNNEVYVNEINTIPGALSYYLWEATNIPFSQLMDKLVQLALKRDRELKLKTHTYDANIFNLGGGVKGSKTGVK